jgi:DNA-binding transcriptional LysR family regulator
MKRKLPSQMKLSQLNILVAIAERSSFSEAALDLEMSQSAVSNAILALEADLGVTLFSRGRHGANLTSVGERVLIHARQILQIREEILKEVNFAKSLQAGKVRLTAIRSVATQFLPGIITRFKQQCPDAAVSVVEQFSEASVEEDLRKGRADIGFTDDQVGDEFVTGELFKDEYVVLLPPSFPVPNRQLSWEVLRTCPLIIPANEFSSDRRAYAHCDAFCQITRTDYYAKSDSTIVNMVAQGLGATIIPRLAAEPIPSKVQVFSLPTPFFRTIRFAVLNSASLPPETTIFLKLLRPEFHKG